MPDEEIVAEDEEIVAEETLELGGNIELSGFHTLDRDTMIVLKKMVGNYAKKFSETCKKFEKLSLKMKLVHERERSEKYELKGMVVDGGKQYNSDITERNLFFGVDKIFKKIEAMIK